MKLSLARISCMLVFSWIVSTSIQAIGQEYLASWNESAAKQAIVDFVNEVTDEDADTFVPAAERIAVFDNDGTLWCEYPVPNQVAFAVDEIKRLLPDNPEWKNEPAIEALIKGDLGALLADHHRGLLKIIALTHADMTNDEFNHRVSEWLGTSKHPRFNQPYTRTVYQPMLELLRYLRANGFETWIVSGGGQEFMRVFAEETYGIPPQQIVGSYGRLKYELKNGKPTLTKTLDTLFVDDKEGKPAGIAQFIGRRPIACFGNSDGDQAMLEYTTIDNPRPSFGLIVHHTDAEREYAYDANPTSSGKLVTALADAPKRGWTVVNMKDDWKVVFPGDTESVDGELTGTEWLVEDIGGQGVVDRSHLTVEFAPDGTVSGDTGVNRFSGKATIDGQAMSFGLLATTRRAGPPALMDQEQKFVQALGSVKGYRAANEGIIEFYDGDNNVVMRLSRILH